MEDQVMNLGSTSVVQVRNSRNGTTTTTNHFIRSYEKYETEIELSKHTMGTKQKK